MVCARRVYLTMLARWFMSLVVIMGMPKLSKMVMWSYPMFRRSSTVLRYSCSLWCRLGCLGPWVLS